MCKDLIRVPSILRAASCLFVCLGYLQYAQSQTAEYDLTIDYQTVNFTGKDVEALTINVGIPGPTLTFTEGDQAIIRIHNNLDVETSLHWHGILLPNAQDGVPYLTTYPIEAGLTHTFEFPLIQSGTYWYHSHTGLQEQRGVFGFIVIHPGDPSSRPQTDADHVLMLSDWTDEKPDQVMRTLKRGSEWYSIKKGTAQNWDRVIAHGNASASTYFHFQYAGGPMQIIAAEGLGVSPVEVDRILIAIAETYDVLVTVPDGGAFEFRATAQDGSGKASLYLGEGAPIHAPEVPGPDLFRMDHMNRDSRADSEYGAGLGAAYRF